MKKNFQKSYKYRLKPKKEHLVLFAEFAGSTRYIYNFGLGQIKKSLEDGNKIPTYNELSQNLTRMKITTPWLAAIHSQVLQQTLIDLSRSVYAYFKSAKTKDKRGFPKFKKKYRHASFRYPQNIRCESGKIFLPKIGWVSYRDSRPLEGIIKQATVKRQGEHWYVCITCNVEMDVPEIVVTEDTTLGIDVGLAHFISTSEGNHVPNPTYLKDMLDKLRKLSKSLSRKKKYSANWKKCCAKLRRLHSKIANMRGDFLHKLSTTLIKSHGVSMLCVEDLNVKGMVQNRKLSRSISDAGWGMFYKLLQYKSQWQGKSFVKVNRFYPSSKLCSSCGSKQEMPLSIRTFNCESCGLKIDRDINAALNIRSAGITELNACGEMRIGGLREAGISGF